MSGDETVPVRPIKADPSHVFAFVPNLMRDMCKCGARLDAYGAPTAAAVGYCELAARPKAPMKVVSETSSIPDAAATAPVEPDGYLGFLEDLEVIAEERTADETAESREYYRRVQRVVAEERARLKHAEFDRVASGGVLMRTVPLAIEHSTTALDPEGTPEARERSRRTVVFDFDGVTCQYRNGWTGVEPTEDPVPGALEAINALYALGYEVVIVSSRCRHPDGAGAIERWLAKHGFPALRVTDVKVPGVVYLDDRGFRFKGDFMPFLDFMIRGDLSPWERPGKAGVVRRTTVADSSGSVSQP